MTLYDFFKNASIDEIAELLAGLGASVIFESFVIHKDLEQIKTTEMYKSLYEEYREILHKEI